MATDKPRIQAYIDPELYQDLQEFQALHGLRESGAVNQILKEYFGRSDSQESTSTFQLPSPDELKLLIQEELWGEGKSEFIEGIKTYVQEVVAGEVTDAREYWRRVDTRERVDRHQIEIAKLQERIETLEKICQPIEGLAELSKPMETGEENGQGLAQPVDSKVEDFQWTGDNAIELNLSQLARRLGISKSVLSRRKSQADFMEWSKGNKAKDPEGRTWHYNPERQIFRGIL